MERDPVTDEDVDLMWVKGSGGDLGTLTEAGLAVLRLDRLRSLVAVYPGAGPGGRDGAALLTSACTAGVGPHHPSTLRCTA